MNASVAEDTRVSFEDVAAKARRLYEAQAERAGRERGGSYKDRVEKLDRLEAAILGNLDDIRRASGSDFSKPPTEIELSEIMPALGEIRYTRKHLRKWMRPKKVRPTLTMLGNSAEIRYEPKGVALIISPWNYPFTLSFGPLVSAIAAGCNVILKPSEMTPHASELIASIIAETFDEDEIAVVEGGVEVSQALLELPFDHIFFTGSPQVGRIVAAAASKHLASVTLELGGKSPVIVDETADLAQAAKRICWGKFINNGQTCIAPDHVYVHESVKARFADELQKVIDRSFGTSIEARFASPDYCRIVNDKHYDRITKTVDEAIDAGARRLTLEKRDAESRYIAPTILDDVPKDCRLMQEEIFGPVLPLLSYTDLDDAISDINSRPKPLALYVYSKEKQTVDKLLSDVQSGDTAINHNVIHFLHKRLPFGGIGNSGVGKSHGHFGFLAFSHQRSVVRNWLGIVDMMFPPYTATVHKLTLFLRKYLA